MHLPAPIFDLALILIVAGFISLLFRWLQQPLVLGYLVAGILVGPQIRFLPTVVEMEHLKTWTELGVIFLLFLLGIEFSFKKLFRVGAPALIAATVEVFGMILIGFLCGRLLGWNAMNSLFLGGILSISSTTIIVKAFDELGVRSQYFASTVIGILIIEDLYAILLLALLGTFGATQSFSGIDLLYQVLKLGGFLIVVIPFGLWFLPRSLKVFHHHLNDETRVVIAVGGCLVCVVLATTAGFSPALGAFLMGAFIAETIEGERQERILKPIRDLFGAVFFTSVGMLVDVRSLGAHWKTVLLISFVTILGKMGCTILGMRLGRSDRRLALQTGLSLAQIGEFSFIIVTLGLSLNVILPELYPITVAVSVVTTFTTPYLIKLALFQSLKKPRRKAGSQRQHLWDGHVVELEVHPHYTKVGHTLEQLKLREKFGVTVVSIQRGERNILSPTRTETIMPYDRLKVFGADTKLLKIVKHLRSDRYETGEHDEKVFGLEKLTLTKNAKIVGKTILTSGIRESIDGLILGIERKGEKILNPDSKMTLDIGDELWLYGNLEKIKHL